MKTFGVLTQFSLLMDCADVLKSVDLDQWEQFSPEQKRGIGLLGRWVIEKALWSVIVARGEVPPFNASLMELHEMSGMGLPREHKLSLAMVDERITTQEFCDDDIEEDYRKTFRFAHYVRSTADGLVTMWDVEQRKT